MIKQNFAIALGLKAVFLATIGNRMRHYEHDGGPKLDNSKYVKRLLAHLLGLRPTRMQ
jgi:hypothetical protein